MPVDSRWEAPRDNSGNSSWIEQLHIRVDSHIVHYL